MNWLWENTATYDFAVAEHNFNVLAGYTSQKERTEFQSVTAANFPNDLVQTINAGTVTGGTSTASEWAIQSYLGRVNYNFRNKYFYRPVSGGMAVRGSAATINGAIFHRFRRDG
ncbi:hypothetical protein LWM68_24260 [Niabella sp. W65]|nr:hypothetical protein [Niabella sp. W65]MCH7365613.1 hypothetical protein [Niabella sp. W65]ULT41386.1 hypothetical protein KRR40_43135 [Niabella sp. I65]